MKLIVRPKYERGRTFKYLPQAMRFAEAARLRQGTKPGPVVVVALHDQRGYNVGYYGRDGQGSYRWTWYEEVR